MSTPGGLYVARPRELVELVVLCLLSEQPRHVYDIQRELKHRQNTRFLTGLPRSLYTAVDALAVAGLIHKHGTDRVDGRPERTVYALTDDGERAWRERLTTLTVTPSDQLTFYASLSLIVALGARAAADALTARADALESLARKYQSTLNDVGLARIYVVEVEFLQAQLEAEAVWVRSIAADIHAGTLRFDVTSEAR